MGAALSVSLVIFSIYFCFLLGALLVTSRGVDSPWLFLLRSLFPNWRFYHAPGDSPRLYFRYLDAGLWSDWQQMMPRFKRRLFNLLFNPGVNLALTEQNLVDHLANDIADCQGGNDVSALVVYQMVERLVRQIIAAEGGHIKQFQFRVCLVPSGAAFDMEAGTILLSPCLDY